MPLMGHVRQSHVPRPINLADFHSAACIPWRFRIGNRPQHRSQLLLLVDTRLSAVLGIVFRPENRIGAKFALGLFIAIAVLFLMVELVSLVAGIQLSRTITGAVHELYEGTQHVKEGDFSYRIPVKGNDQLAELTTFVQHHDRKPGPPDRGGQGKGAPGIGAGHRARSAGPALPEGRALHARRWS